MENVKILHIISDLNVAGAQTVVMNYLRQMSNDSEFEIYLLITGTYKGSVYEEECVNSGYNIIYTNYKYWNGIPILKQIVNWVKFQIGVYKKINDIKPNIIHSHVTTILPYILLPLLFSKAKIKFHTLHSDPYAIGDKFIKWARFAFKRCGIYPICVTEGQAQKAKQRYGIKELAIIHNGLDLNKYQIIESKDSIRKSIGISQDAFVVGCVSRLDKIKNFGFFVEVFAELKKIKPNAIMLLVGEGSEKQSIVSLAKELYIDDSVVFVGLRNDVERMYKAFDVFMLTSFSESSSIVTVEAQLSGIRCVVSSGVPSNVVISNQVNRLSLDTSKKMWVDALLDKLPKETQIYSVLNFSLLDTINMLKDLYKKYL